MLHNVDSVRVLHTRPSNLAGRNLQLARKTESGTRADIGAKQRGYLRDTLSELRMTPSGMAAAIGMAPSTFTRFMKEPDSSEKTLAATTMDKVEQLRQVNSDNSFPTQAQAQWSTVREEATQLKLDDNDELGKLITAIMNGRNGIDAWTLNTRALELEGFMPGDVVLVDLNAIPKPGDAVCAQVFDRSHSRSDTVMRLFQNAGPVNVLLPRSMDPDTQGALVVDNDRVLIRGVLLPHRLRAKIAA
jgi:hypothetical protein